MAGLCLTDQLTGSILFDCNSAPVAGVNSQIVLINRADVDRAATSFESGYENEVMTNLTLLSGKTSKLLEGYQRSNNPGFDIVKKENRPDGVTHVLEFVVFQLTKDNKKSLNEFLRGARVIAVVRNIYEGPAQKDAFEIYGYATGLEISDGTRRLNADDGVTPITLSSVAGEEEPTMPYTFLVNDSYADTLAAFEALKPA
jgi:hypothetical protein